MAVSKQFNFWFHSKNVEKMATVQFVWTSVKETVKFAYIMTFHFPSELIDVYRLWNKTQNTINRNDLPTCNLVHMFHIHIYITLFCWNIKFLFRIWITVKIYMIGRFMITMATIQNNWRQDYFGYVTEYFAPSMTSMGCLFFQSEMFQHLANLKHCYVTMAIFITASIFKTWSERTMIRGAPFDIQGKYLKNKKKKKTFTHR